MLKELIGNHGSMLPQFMLVFFFLIALIVILYIVTDRRRGHRQRMESMPLDDGIPLEKDK